MVSQNIRLEIALSTLNTTIFVVALFVVRRTFLNEFRSLLISVYTQLCSPRYTYINQLVTLARVEKNVRDDTAQKSLLFLTVVDWYFIKKSGICQIGHVNEYPTMHCFGIPRHTQSMIAYKILTEYFWKFQ